MPDLPAEIECPQCAHRVWCSEEDPDAGLSEMRRHIYWTHALAADRRTTAAQALTAELLAKVTVVPDA